MLCLWVLIPIVVTIQDDCDTVLCPLCFETEMSFDFVGAYHYIVEKMNYMSPFDPGQFHRLYEPTRDLVVFRDWLQMNIQGEAMDFLEYSTSPDDRESLDDKD
jgi:hypothetical protein